MNLGIKFLIGGVALATSSCGGYMIYKKVSSVEKTIEKAVSGDQPSKELKNPPESSQPKTTGGTAATAK